MFIYILLLIPIIATIVCFFWFKHEVVWWEYLLNFGVALICIFASKAIIEHTQVTDTEYWGGWVHETRYYEDWNEYIHRTCSRTVSCGKDCSRTEYYDCSYVDYHPEYWEIRNSNNEVIRVSEKQYNELVKKFGTGKSFVDMKRDYHSDDGDMYRCKWSGSLETLEATVTTHSYENRVRVSSSTFALQEPPEEIFEQYGLYHYPKIYDKYKQRAILGYDDPKAEKLLQTINAKFGAKYQFKAFVMVFKGQPREAGQYQEEQWQGGNKNELNITIGVDENNNVKWCHVFSWTEEKGIVVNTRNYVQEQEKLDIENLLLFLMPQIEKTWVRKNFDEFDYLTVEPKNIHILISFIVTLIICSGTTFYVIVNEATEDRKTGYRR